MTIQRSDLKMHHQTRHTELTLYPVGPFRLDLTVWTLRRRPENHIDHWDGETYSRVLLLVGEPVEVRMTETRRLGTVALVARVRHSGHRDDIAAALPKLLTQILGLDVDLTSFYKSADNDPVLRDLVRPFVGMKPPKFPSLFEAITNGIACQQLSLAVGIGLLNKLTRNFGRGLSNEPHGQHSFPDPVGLLAHTANDLRALGFSFAKARAVLSLAKAINDGQWNADAISRMSDGDALKSLETLPGVGRWTAEYALLRGLGRLHVFPADDVGARNNLQSWLGISEPLDYARTRRLLSRWSGFGGLIYFHLLLKKLHEAGHL